MKTYLVVLALLSNIFLIAQSNDSKVSKIPVYIGCEANIDNRSLMNCMSERLNEDMTTEVAYFANIADYLHIDHASTNLKFTIDNKKGIFSNFYPQGENPIFNSVAISGLILLQAKMNKLGLKVEPAKDKNNNPVNFSLNVPLYYNSEKKDNNFDHFPAYNRVLFTLKTNEETIEIRINKDFMLTTYGKNVDREYYLGKFSNLFELALEEPYASAFENSFKTGVIDITKGVVDGKEYHIQIKNFFKNNPESKISIIVYRTEGNDRAEFYEYNTKKEFNDSKFAKLTYR